MFFLCISNTYHLMFLPDVFFLYCSPFFFSIFALSHCFSLLFFLFLCFFLNCWPADGRSAIKVMQDMCGNKLDFCFNILFSCISTLLLKPHLPYRFIPMIILFQHTRGCVCVCLTFYSSKLRREYVRCVELIVLRLSLS